MAGSVLYNTRGDVSAFVRGNEVFTFCRRHIGRYDRGLFRSMGGEPIGTVGAARPPRFRRRRRRFQITPWLRFSLPAPRPQMTFRTWAIWDREIDALSA